MHIHSVLDIRRLGILTSVLFAVLFAFSILSSPDQVSASHCDSDEVHASDGQCYDGDLYDPDYLCAAGLDDYCDQGDGNADDPWNCPSGEIMQSNGECIDEDEYEEAAEAACDGGGNEDFCEQYDAWSDASNDGGGSGGGGSGGGGERGVQHNPENYSCPQAAEYANSRDVDSAEWDRLYNNYASDLACGSVDACRNLSGNQSGIPTNYTDPTGTGNCEIQNQSLQYYVGQDGVCSWGANQSVAQCSNGLPRCDGQWVVDTGGVQTCMPDWEEGEEPTEDGSGEGEQNTEEPTDYCPNLGGTQTGIPEGYMFQNGQCVPASDVCPNINGTQTSVPSGHTLQGGQCVPVPQCSGGGKGGGSQTCTCPSGYIVQGNQCVSSCPSGQQVQNGVCVPSSCPIGQSVQGGVCAPIQCPAGYTLSGNNCVAMTCPAGFILQGGACVRNCVNQCSGMNVVNSCTGEVVTTCSYQCSLGTCTEPPPPEVTTWRVTPLLIQRGSTVSITWEVENVTGCSVSRSSGSDWTGVSGSHTEAIEEETVYTLSCEGIDGSPIIRTSTVRIVPGWQEV